MKKDRIVYRGGHHLIVCDGRWHYCVTDRGRTSERPCWCKKKGKGKNRRSRREAAALER